MNSYLDLALWLAILGGGMGLVLEALNRSWLGVASWIAALAGVAVRYSPIPQHISEVLSIAFTSLFLVLVIIRVIRKLHRNGT